MGSITWYYKIYEFKFILIGDFHQLNSIETIHYDVINSEVFADICDGQILELTYNWRAQNDPEFGEFIQDLRVAKNGGKPDFKTYSVMNVENRCAGLIRQER